MNKQSWILLSCVAALIVIVLFTLFFAGDETLQSSNRQPIDSPVRETVVGEMLPTSPGDASASKEPTTEPDPTKDEVEQRAAFLEKVEPLFGSREKRRGLLYRMVVESLDKESAPFLRELLQDEAYKDRWSEIGIMLAWLSDKDDRESVAAILDYIRRPNTWPADNPDSILDDTVAKGATFQKLGLFNSDIVSEPLLDAFTEEGAERLISPWINIQKSVEPLHLIYIVRSWAAKGLVLTRAQENIDVVRENYEILAHKMLTVEYREKDVTREMWLEAESFLAFAGGMADNDMLAELGIEASLRLRDDGETWATNTSRHLFKYLGTDLDDGRIIMDKCPVCGKVAE